MLFNEFSQTYFKPANDFQNRLIEEFRKLRAKQGIPHRFRILRSLAKTRNHTYTIYPPGWKFE